MDEFSKRDFWGEVFTWRSAVTPYIASRVVTFGVISAGIWYVAAHTSLISPSAIAHYELIGAALAVLLMLRTNTGYDRWYEGRKLWGGIVNQSRNLAQIGLAYGPRDREWRSQFVRWVAAFPHACRHSLRGNRKCDDLQELLGDELDDLQSAQHLPLYVSQRLADLLKQAVDDDRSCKPSTNGAC
jgi:putative membrane protein